MIKDEDKTKEELILELEELRRNNIRLGKFEKIYEQSKEALYYSYQLLRKTFSSLKDAILIIDSDTIEVLDCNPAACEIFGYMREELVGKSPTFLHEDEDTLNEFIKKLFQDTEVKGYLHLDNFTMKRKDGILFFTEISVIPVKNEKNIQIAWVSIVRDISERKKIAQELKLHRDNLEELVEQRTEVLTEAIGQLQKEIIEREKAEKALKNTNQTLQSIVDASPAAIISLDIEGKVNMWSPAAEKIFGWKEKEVLGITNPIVTKEDKKEFESLFNRVIGGEGYLGLEAVRRRKDGTFIDISVSTSPFYDETGNIAGAIGVISDITNRKSAERSLKESEKRYRDLYNRTPVMLHSIDREGRLLSVSDYWLEIMGFDREEVLGRKSTDFLTEESQTNAKDVYLSDFFEKGFSRNLEYQFVKKNGEIFDVILSATAERDHTGQIARSLAVITDISELKKTEKKITKYQSHLEDLVEERTLELKKTHEQLVRAEHLVATGKLAAYVAHEINSPLQAIISLLASLEKNYKEDSELLRKVDLLKEGFNSIKNTVISLLDLTRREKEQKQETNVNVILQKTINLLKAYLRNNRIKIKMELCSGDPEVFASPQQLSQIFINLVNNSVEAINEEKSAHRLKSKPSDWEEIFIKTELNKKNVTISFSDTGPGIDKEKIKYIFEPFYTGKKKIGMGLGLSICFRIIKDHNGYIDAKNLPGRGAMFIIKIPIKQQINKQ